MGAEFCWLFPTVIVPWMRLNSESLKLPDQTSLPSSPLNHDSRHFFLLYLTFYSLWGSTLKVTFRCHLCPLDNAPCTEGWQSFTRGAHPCPLLTIKGGIGLIAVSRAAPLKGKKNPLQFISTAKKSFQSPPDLPQSLSMQDSTGTLCANDCVTSSQPFRD